MSDLCTFSHFDMLRFAEAATDLVHDDLKDLYEQRLLNPRGPTGGPERDAAQAAANISSLTSQLLPHIIRYLSSMIRLREEQLRLLQKKLDDTSDGDVPW